MVPVRAVSNVVGVTCAEGSLHAPRQVMQWDRAAWAPIVRRSPDSFGQHQRQPADKQRSLIRSFFTVMPILAAMLCTCSP